MLDSIRNLGHCRLWALFGWLGRVPNLARVDWSYSCGLHLMTPDASRFPSVKVLYPRARRSKFWNSAPTPQMAFFEGLIGRNYGDFLARNSRDQGWQLFRPVSDFLRCTPPLLNRVAKRLASPAHLGRNMPTRPINCIALFLSPQNMRAVCL